MKKALVLLLLLGAASSVFAVGVTTTWKITGTQDWSTASNWSAGLPTNETGNSTTLYASTSQANGPIVSTTDATALAVRLGGAGGPSGTTAHLTIATGGLLTVGDFLLVAPDSTTGGGRNGYLHVEGGTISALTGQGMIGIGNGADGNPTGSQNITGTLNMTAGTINCNLFKIGANLTKGYAYLTGGTINTAAFQMRPNASNPNAPLLDVSGTGKIIINGNVVSTVQGYIDNGWIKTNGVEADYSIVSLVDGKTVIAVPEPATMMLLGLGALGFIRRK